MGYEREIMSVFSATPNSSLPTDNHVVIPMKPTRDSSCIFNVYINNILLPFQIMENLAYILFILKLPLLTKDLGKLSKPIHNKLHSFILSSFLLSLSFLPSFSPLSSFFLTPFSFLPSLSLFHCSKNFSHAIYLLYKLLSAQTNNCQLQTSCFPADLWNLFILHY